MRSRDDWDLWSRDDWDLLRDGVTIATIDFKRITQGPAAGKYVVGLGRDRDANKAMLGIVEALNAAEARTKGYDAETIALSELEDLVNWREWDDPTLQHEVITVLRDAGREVRDPELLKP
jgi:hypothetical protein